MTFAQLDNIILGDNLEILKTFPDEVFDLIYLDPPFNTGLDMKKRTLKMTRGGERDGFGGNRYDVQELARLQYNDYFDDYYQFLFPRLAELYRVLKSSGSLFIHLDWREIHYIRIFMDNLFGRENCLNEIIWSWDYGAKSKKYFPRKHNNILWYVKDTNRYYFDIEQMDRLPYLAPELVSKEKAELGKLPTDCYSEDTEVLTFDGWKLFSNVSLNDKFATVSPDWRLSYCIPSKIYSDYYNGEMYHFHTKTIDLLVTPNHKMYVAKKNNKRFEFISAEKLEFSSQYVRLGNQLFWDGQNTVIDTFGFSIEDFCTFMGWYLSEGFVTIISGKRYEIGISQTKRWGRKQIESLLSRMGVRYWYNSGSYCFANKKLALFLKDLGKAHEKYIPRNFMFLPKSLLNLMWNSLMAGDGYKRGNYEVYFTVSQKLANDVQELLLKIGYNSSITISKSNNQKWRDKYCVFRRTSKESTIWRQHISTIEYSGMIYCVGVEPYHTLIVRRNGRVAISGNSWWISIVGTNSKEKTSYPTQKPEKLLQRIILPTTKIDDLVLDPFAGSGTTGKVCMNNQRKFVLIDNNPDAIKIMQNRLFPKYKELLK